MGCLLHFFGEKRQKCAFWCVYIHHSFPLEYNVYSFIWSSVILKEKKKTLWLHNLAWFLFLNPLRERPASICTGAVTSTVDSLSDVWQFKRKKEKKTLCTKTEAAFSPLCYHGNFTGYDKNYFCTEECCILEQLLPCKQKQCKILSII